MRVVPTGKFPAAALAAAMINQERCEDWFDVDHAAATGNLVELPPEQKRLHLITIRHDGVDKFCRVKSRRGMVYTALANTKEQQDHLDAAKQILNLYVDHLRQPMVVADVAYHEKAWVKSSSAPPKRVFHKRVASLSVSECLSSTSPGEDFWWFVEPLHSYYALMGSPEYSLLDALTLNQLALVQDLRGRLHAKMQIGPDWYPTLQNLQVPRVRDHGCLVLRPVEGSPSKKLAHLYPGIHQQIAWGGWIDPSTGLRLKHECVPREARYLLKKLRQVKMCHVCRGALSGICGTIRRRLDPDRGEWVTLCWVCTGMALHCLSLAESGTKQWRYLCVYDTGIPVQGLEIEYDPMGPVWHSTDSEDETLGVVNHSRFPVKGVQPGLSTPHLQDLGSGVVINPRRTFVLVPT